MTFNSKVEKDLFLFQRVRFMGLKFQKNRHENS